MTVRRGALLTSSCLSLLILTVSFFLLLSSESPAEGSAAQQEVDRDPKDFAQSATYTPGKEVKLTSRDNKVELTLPATLAQEKLTVEYTPLEPAVSVRLKVIKQC